VARSGAGRSTSAGISDDVNLTAETSGSRGWATVESRFVAGLADADALASLGSGPAGLSESEATARRELVGPNALRRHRARPLSVLARQLANPLLLLLVGAAAVSLFLGEGADATIIVVIVALSVGLGFVNEYRSEQAVEALHAAVRHEAIVRRDGGARSIDVVDLVPGDIVELRLGEIVPADVRVLDATGLECGEAVLTGESTPVVKRAGCCAPETDGSPFDLSSIAFMGTVVTAGSGEGVVVATGPRTAFGGIAAGLGERHPPTAFQEGLAGFSRLLVSVAAVLCSAIFVINVALGRSVLDSLLFSLAIAIGITPQLLPAIVTVSLATGARRLTERRVVVKRLVIIEDLGNVEVLFTDKTGTLTEGRVTFEAALGSNGDPSPEVLAYGLACTEGTRTAAGVVGANALDAALWEAPDAVLAASGWSSPVAVLPFDHDRRLISVLVDGRDGRRLQITKGAPETVVVRCRSVPGAAAATLDGLLGQGARVVAVAVRPAPDAAALQLTDERNLELVGFLSFVDQPKVDAAAALTRLTGLGITVKVLTGDHPTVAEAVFRRLGLLVTGVLTGADLDALDDTALARAVATASVFARVTPAQKARVIRAERSRGRDVAFLGDGVNDAIALHAADVGISVDTGSDVAKDAADVVLVDKSLAVIADAVVEGRRIFANTVKYVLMATSSNVGNMVSAGVASVVLDFLPMLPGQILVNNLLYDTSQLAIPTDNVDEELLRRPAQWDIGLIRRFMLLFGPISSLFDALTFVVLLRVLHAGPVEFRSGWFVESLATQTLVIFVIRTRRVPWWRSRPSAALAATTLACASVAVALPYSPLADLLGFTPLPAEFLVAVALMTVAYLSLVEVAKAWFFGPHRPPRPVSAPVARRHRRTQRRAARFSTR
jgi:Mg2+-importing ATPase